MFSLLLSACMRVQVQLCLFLVFVAVGSSGQVLQTCLEKMGRVLTLRICCAQYWATARGGRAVEVGPLRLLVVLPG